MFSIFINEVILQANRLTFQVYCYKMDLGDIISFNATEINSVKITFYKEKSNLILTE